MARILVAVDGSPASIRALSFALDMSRGEGRRTILLANVQNVATLGLGDAIAIMPEGWEKEVALSQSQRQLRKAIALCRKAKAACEVYTENGPIAETIVRLARQKKADHIVMGTRGLGGVKGLLLGSTTTQVVHLTDTPVTLIK